MRKCLFLLFLFVLPSVVALAQQKTISGVVVDETNEPLIGVSVVVKGTTTGVITDFDGRYALSVPENSTISFSYIGMKLQEIKVPSSTSILNVTMQSDSQLIDEVVVTAMGIRQEKKRMNFAVQSVNSDALTESRSANFVNALQGKVSGLSVTTAGGSPNAGSQVIIRGISSINTSQSNEPLLVLDGMPISSASSASDINPNDIENITILKGAAAAALYGQDAANGVIMITTKRGQIGKVSVTANTSWQYDIPTRVQKLQTSYVSGDQGFYKEKTLGGWGPLLQDGEIRRDNVSDFLQTGFYQKYDLSLTGGNEKFQAYASANYSKSEGIILNDYLNKFGMLLKATYQPFESLNISVSANIMDNSFRSFNATGMEDVYKWPITDKITDYEEGNGFPRFLYYNDSKKFNSPYSPLYSRHNDYGLNKRTRNILSGSINWTPIKKLEIIGRASYEVANTSYDGYEVPRWDDSFVYDIKGEPNVPGEGATPEEMAQYKLWQEYLGSSFLLKEDVEKNMDKKLLGQYSATSGESYLFTASALATYKIDLPADFSVDLLAGSEVKMAESRSTSSTGRDFIIPGVYSMLNTNPNSVDGYLLMPAVTHGQWRTFGHYGEIRGDYKGIASLSVTGRWDWSSRLVIRPYFYPSITAGLLFSELFDLSSDVFNYGKIRGNYAKVGKDAKSQALFDRKYKQFTTYPDNGYGIDPTLTSADMNLMPEMSYSWEIGADFRFFNNKTRLDIAYYVVGVDNQIVNVRVSPTSGHIIQTRNEGSIRNQGSEFTLDQDVFKTKDFNWTALLNFGLNRGKVISLPEDVGEITGSQYGDIFTSAYLGASTTAITGKDYLRTDDGKIICDASGYPQIDPVKNKQIGNREAKFSAGLTNTLNYKAWSLSFLFDGRLGGDVANITGRGLISNGQNKMLEAYRGRQIVVDGVVLQADGTYAPNTTAITLDHHTITNSFHAVSSNFIEDGSYIRLSYLTLGYDFSKLIKESSFTSLHASFTGNNLFLLTKYTGSDPARNADTDAKGTGSAGIDNYGVPSTRGFNFSIKASF